MHDCRAYPYKLQEAGGYLGLQDSFICVIAKQMARASWDSNMKARPLLNGILLTCSMLV